MDSVKPRLLVAQLVGTSERVLPTWVIHLERRSVENVVVASATVAGEKVRIALRFTSLNGVELQFTTNGEMRRLSLPGSNAPSESRVDDSTLAAVTSLIGDESRRVQPDHRLLAALFHCLSLYLQRGEGTALPQEGNAVPDLQIQRAVELIGGALAHAWTVESLAKAVGLSRPVLARRFLAVLGLPPMRYLTQRRMEAAARLLVGTAATLAEVAAAVGYDSEFAFSRAFKRHFRLPPGEYRRTTTCVATNGSAVNRGVVNRGVVNRGVVNRGVVNRGVVNRGVVAVNMAA